jgi:nitrite reductase (NADH) small subunit
MADAPTVPGSKTVNLGSIEKVPQGQGFCFIVAGQEIAVFRQRDGKIFATQNRCPHKQAPLAEGVSGGGQVICPFHSHKFDLCTGQGPEKELLRVYPVREIAGEIILTLGPSP